MDTKDITPVDPEQTDVTGDTDTELGETPVRKSRSYGLLTVFILLIALAAATGLGANYFWQQQIRLQQQLQQQQQNTADRLQSQAEQNTQQQQQMAQRLQSQNSLIQQLQADINTLQELSQNALEVSQRGQRGWILAEIDYLLRLANRRLQIARDINGAIAALGSASERLYELGDLSLFPVRQQLAKEIAQLKALQQIDVNGIALALDQINQHLAELPFKSVQQEIAAQIDDTDTQPAKGNSKDFVDQVISTVMQIGDIKIHQRSIQAASSAQQQQQYEQMLQNHLLSARLAVLGLDQKQFAYDIEQAQKILQQHYQQDDNRVSQLGKDLLGFARLKLRPELPSVTGSWHLLHKLLAETESNKLLESAP